MTLYQINVFCFISLQHYDSVLGSKSWGLGTIEIWPGSEADSYFCIKLLSQVWCSELLRWCLGVTGTDGHYTYGHSPKYQCLAVMLKMQSMLLTKGLFIT